jgi:hypothetical protein
MGSKICFFIDVFRSSTEGVLVKEKKFTEKMISRMTKTNTNKFLSGLEAVSFSI